MITPEKIAELPADVQPYVTAQLDKPGMDAFAAYLHALFGPQRPVCVDTLSAAAPVGAIETDLSGMELRASATQAMRPELAEGLQAVRGWLRRIPGMVHGRHIVTPRLEKTLHGPSARREQFTRLADLALYSRVQLYDGTLPVAFRDTNAIYITDTDGGVAVYSEALTYRPDNTGTLRIDPARTHRRFDQPGTTYAREMYAEFSQVADVAMAPDQTAEYYQRLAASV
jgi:hypothetical protein